MDNISDNVGNTYILYAICKDLLGYVPNTINGIPNLFNSDLTKYNTDDINNNYSYVIINMQDQLRRDISYYPNTNEIFLKLNIFLKKINLPFIIFGLGSNCFNPKNFNNIVDELHQSQIDFLKIISSKSIFFTIRGKYTKILLDNLNIKNYNMTGCNTFFYNKNKFLIKKNKIENVVLTGNYIYEKKIHNFCNNNNIKYYFFCQDITEINIIKKHFDNNKNDNIFFSVSMEETNLFFQDKDMVVGSRVHAAIMGFNNNILSFVYNIDSRAKEMCDLFKIPLNIKYDNSNIIELYNKISNSDIDLINKNYNTKKIYIRNI